MKDRQIPLLSYRAILGLDSGSIQKLRFNSWLREHVVYDYRRSWKHAHPVKLVQELIRKYEK